jgi:hypothetical protein
MLPAIPADYAWIASRAKLAITPQFRAIKAVDAGGQIRGMVGFDGWTPNAVSLHIALTSPLALRCLIGPAFGIAFKEFGRGVALAMVLSDNAESLRLVRKAGFREKHRIRDGWTVGTDMVMFEMRKDECRWLADGRREAA